MELHNLEINKIYKTVSSDIAGIRVRVGGETLDFALGLIARILIQETMYYAFIVLQFNGMNMYNVENK